MTLRLFRSKLDYIINDIVKYIFIVILFRVQITPASLVIDV